MKVLYTITLLVLSLTIFSQKGKNGALSVSTANVRINEFTTLTANASAGNTTINVAASTLNANSRFPSALAAGDLVMIIQMQGALIKLKPYNPWEAYVTDSLYGQIYSYQSCGNYEFAQVKTVISATQIELECGLKYDYSVAGKTQIVRVPRYNALTVTGTGTLTTDPWNGTTGIGGVLVAEVDGNTTINGIVTASGLGFRGGLPTASGGTDFFPFSSATPTNKGSEKGEGIGSNRLNNSIDSLGNYCKGAPGNAGGGGNANNCGGGGGANGGIIANYNGHGNPGAGFNAIWNLEWPGKATVTSSGGGKGGYGTSTTTTTNINSVGPNNTAWGSFRRLSAGGFGGRPLDYSTGKIFLGGGGGAGHTTSGQSNGAGACAGGAGGGLVFLLNYGTISGSGSIISNGANGGNAFGTGNFTNPQQGIDGAGGAGAGGTIILKSNGTISGITASANGGKGGDQIKSGTLNSEGQGPGGGGSGGYIAATNIGFTQNVNGGANGTTNASAFDTEFPMNGATSGDAGTNNQSIAPSFSLTASANQTLCTNQSATLTATSNDPSATVFWYNAAAGGNSVASGTVFVTPTYTATGTYTVYAGSCPGIYRVPIIINVGSGATITVNSPTICPGQTVTLTATGATTYTWSTGPTTSTISVSPASTTVYTVNATSGTCVGTQTTQVLVSPTPTVSVASVAICSGSSATLTANGATNYTWSPGSQTTTSIVVSPTLNTTYTITGANGTCTNSTTATVSVTSTPTLSTSSRTICAGQVATFTVSGATTYTWNPGSATGITYTTNPASSGTVSVLGANGTCTAQVTTSITVPPNPTVAVSNQTICSGQSAILTATGATTYSWNTGPTTNTISVSPSSLTVYTVTGTTNSCINTRTVSVTVSSQPTVAVANASICSGNATVLTATGATNYTWAPGGQLTNTVSVNPSATTVYTITGATGTCTTSTTATVNVMSTPTLVANSATICPAQTATLTATGATNYTWNPGNVSGSTYTIAPASNTTVSVVGANGTCTTSATVSVTIGTGISISVNNPTICAGQTASLTASGATSYTWTSGPNTNTLNVSPASTTTYTISGTSGACTGSNTAVVTVVSVPSVSVTSASICSGSSVTLTASGASSYTWNPTSQTTTSIVDNPTTTTIYTITGSNGICSNTTTATINVTATPTIVVASTTICPGQTATLTASGATSYTWNPGNITGNTFTMSPASNTVVTIDGANGTCTSSATASITIGSGISISVNSATICAGETTTLTASGATTYTWDTGSNNSSISVSPSSTTVYTISGTSGLCAGLNTSTVTVVSLPTLSVTSASICSGANATLTASGATNYTWAPGGQLTSSITDNPTTTTVYTVTGSNGTCTNTATGSINVTATPTLVANSVTICTGQTATLTASGATSYNWNPGNISGSTYTIAPASNTTVSVVGANGTCTTSASLSVTIGTGISIAVNNPTICAGQTASLTASGATSYTWNSGANTNTLNVTPTSTTIYTISGSNGSCAGINTATVTVNQTPTLSVNSPSMCSDGVAGLNVSGAFTYTWSNGVTGSSQTVNPTTTTVYTVTGTDFNGCVNSTITTATVLVTTMPTVTVNSPTVCAGQTATLTANGATSYSWSTTETTSSINVTPASTTQYVVIGANGDCFNMVTSTVQVTPSPTVSSIPSITSGCATLCVDFLDATSSSATGIAYNFGDGTTANTNNPSHCYTTGGSYTVTATVTNSVLGCSSTFTLPVIDVITRAVADFNISEGNVVTVGSDIHLINTSTGSPDSYSWNVLCTGQISTSTDLTIALADTGNCCIYLIADKISGCSDTVQKCINVVKEAVVIIPNVFTPNGDNRNDVFKVNSTGLKSLHCVIFDRWGLKMYEWDGINGSWDGSAKSGNAPDGTYFYIIDYTDQLDKTTTEKGHLNLFND